MKLLVKVLYLTGILLLIFLAYMAFTGGTSGLLFPLGQLGTGKAAMYLPALNLQFSSQYRILFMYLG